MTVTMRNVTTIKPRFGFKESFMVRCPGAKKKGDGTAAEGVTTAILEAMPMMMANTAML